MAKKIDVAKKITYSFKNTLGIALKTYFLQKYINFQINKIT